MQKTYKKLRKEYITGALTRKIGELIYMEWKKFWETDEMKDFTKKCLHNESMYDYKGSVKIIEDYWQESRDVNEFKRKVLDDERLSNNQGYWQLAKVLIPSKMTQI